MNNDLIEKRIGAAGGSRSAVKSAGDLSAAVELAYRTVLGAPPSGAELDYALTYVENDPERV